MNTEITDFKIYKNVSNKTILELHNKLTNFSPEDLLNMIEKNNKLWDKQKNEYFLNTSHKYRIDSMPKHVICGYNRVCSLSNNYCTIDINIFGKYQLDKNQENIFNIFLVQLYCLYNNTNINNSTHPKYDNKYMEFLLELHNTNTNEYNEKFVKYETSIKLPISEKHQLLKIYNNKINGLPKHVIDTYNYICNIQNNYKNIIKTTQDISTNMSTRSCLENFMVILYQKYYNIKNMELYEHPMFNEKYMNFLSMLYEIDYNEYNLKIIPKLYK
jgi:hypothetical protein